MCSLSSLAHCTGVTTSRFGGVVLTVIGLAAGIDVLAMTAAGPFYRSYTMYFHFGTGHNFYTLIIVIMEYEFLFVIYIKLMLIKNLIIY